MCSSCAAGTYSSTSGLGACSDCEAGTYSSSGASEYVIKLSLRCYLLFLKIIFHTLRWRFSSVCHLFSLSSSFLSNQAARTALRATIRPPYVRLHVLLAAPASTNRCLPKANAWTATQVPTRPRAAPPRASTARRANTAAAGPRRVWRARRATWPLRPNLPPAPPVARATTPTAGPLPARRAPRATTRALLLLLPVVLARQVRSPTHCTRAVARNYTLLSLSRYESVRCFTLVYVFRTDRDH